MTNSRLPFAEAIVIAVLIAGPTLAQAGEPHRTVVVREGKTAAFLEGAYPLKVLKIKGYSVDVRVDGARRVLKLGQSISPDGAGCSIVFEEISPETRIARFATDCP